ncbi:hypothetical protein HPB48_001888 [Haemaphysalis longicornis]|uniref:NR LBD domain-containing protein n=1 Tax=Haemaphysalis longicornis TaxID=44386 RepID=A0A9J6G4I7_HAELO|nr:hypothetical protein HPB48_001888 [Haemaphysalis longicornis]
MTPRRRRCPRRPQTRPRRRQRHLSPPPRILPRRKVSGLREVSHVERVQEQTLSVLLEPVEDRHRQQQHRAARLLLLLGALRAVPATLLEEAFFRPTIGPVPIERILCDVLQTL